MLFDFGFPRQAAGRERRILAGALRAMARRGVIAQDLADLIVRFAMQALLTPTVPQARTAHAFAAYWRLVVRGALAREGRITDATI